MKAKKCEIVSNLDYLTIEKIQELLGKCNYIEEYAYILHDKDVYTEDCFDKKTGKLLHKKGEAKAPHWHIYLQFNDFIDFKYIASYFGLSENFVEKILGKWEDALMYATHKNAPNKYQYPYTAVTSNFDYTKVIEEYMEKKRLQYNYLWQYKYKSI